ncbi:MAG: DUF4358 domain-containing protein [Clostridiales bacterium]|nr:DUF4358 domain-containing protein [Clostridiales bacterium]
MDKMKKFLSGAIVAFVIFAVLFSFTACGEDKNEDKYSVKGLMDKVTNSMTDLPPMLTVSYGDENAESVFSYLSDIDYSKVKDFIFKYSEEGLADEIAIIQLKDEADASSVVEELKTRITIRRSTFITYNESEVMKFNGAKAKNIGNYCILIIGNQASNGIYDFEGAFK